MKIVKAIHDDELFMQIREVDQVFSIVKIEVNKKPLFQQTNNVEDALEIFDIWLEEK